MRIGRVLLSLIVLVGAAWAQPPAARADDCRRSVVIYLDVSGSMYEKRFMDYSEWSQDRPATLMENTVRFLQHCLLNPQTGLVRPGDRLTLMGFYDKVGLLLPALDPFDYDRHTAELARIDDYLDHNKNNKYDLADAAPKPGVSKYRNPYLVNQAEPFTDFLQVVRNMSSQYQDNPVGEGGSYEQLLFFILTDGGHDHPETWDLLTDELEALGKDWAQDLTEKRVKVFFFSLGGDQSLDESEKRVVEQFQKHLGAKHAGLNPSSYNPANLHAMFAELARRIQIQTLYPPEFKQEDGQVIELRQPLTLINESCRNQVVESLFCSVTRVPAVVGVAPADEPGTAAAEKLLLSRKTVPLGLELKPRDSRKEMVDLKAILAAVELTPGRYRLTLQPVTADVGQGAEVTGRDFEIPQPPRSSGGALLLILILLSGIVLAVILFIRSVKNG